MPGLSAQEELLLLQKRARRRLVGAIVLMLVATAVLWRVLGQVQDLALTPDSVVVSRAASAPAQSAALHAPGVSVASAPVGASQPAAQTALPATLPNDLPPLPGPASPAKPQQDKTSPPVTALQHETRKRTVTEVPAAPDKRSQADALAILNGQDGGDSVPPAASPAPKASTAASGQFVIQLAALSDPAKARELRSKLADLGVAAKFSRVETSKGHVTRVRVGPFPSREQASAVLKKLAGAGVNGIVIALH